MQTIPMGDYIKKSDKRISDTYIVLAIIIVAVVLFAGLIYRSVGGQGAAVPPRHVQNVNLTDIGLVMGNGIAYSAIEVNNITDFASSSSLSTAGYKYLSVSEFNATPPHTGTYPMLITSVIYLMANSSAANQLEQSVLYTAGLPSPGASGQLYNHTTVIPFSYRNNQVYMYSISLVSVLNSSYIPSVNQYPIYAYTTVFSYGNYVGFVSISGYENMSQSYSIAIAKLLFQKLINSGAT